MHHTRPSVLVLACVVAPFRRTAGFSATATLSRSDYGIDAWASMIGDNVEVRIEAEAVHSSRTVPAVDDTHPTTEPFTPEPVAPESAADPSAPTAPKPTADPAACC